MTLAASTNSKRNTSCGGKTEPSKTDRHEPVWGMGRGPTTPPRGFPETGPQKATMERVQVPEGLGHQGRGPVKQASSHSTRSPKALHMCIWKGGDLSPGDPREGGTKLTMERIVTRKEQDEDVKHCLIVWSQDFRANGPWGSAGNAGSEASFKEEVAGELCPVGTR